MDLASLGALPRYTCGQLYYYPSFNARRDQVETDTMARSQDATCCFGVGMPCSRHTRLCALQLSVIDAEKMFGWVMAPMQTMTNFTTCIL